jgi:hypothetical protein
MATWPTVTDDDGTGTTGTILDLALFNSVRDYIGTGWTAPSFSAGNFTADASMTWTVASGDVTTYAYQEIGKTMFLSAVVATSTVGGTVSIELRVAVPNGRTIQKTTYGSYAYLDNGTNGTGVWVASSGATYVAFRKTLSGTNWTLSTDNTYILASVFFEIN